MPKQKTYALGIDLGGTKILAAVVDITSGEIIASARKRTKAERGQDFISQRTIELATAALDAAKLPDDNALLAIGVGAAGQIDRQNGVVIVAAWRLTHPAPPSLRPSWPTSITGIPQCWPMMPHVNSVKAKQ